MIRVDDDWNDNEEDNYADNDDTEHCFYLLMMVIGISQLSAVPVYEAPRIPQKNHFLIELSKAVIEMC